MFFLISVCVCVLFFFGERGAGCFGVFGFGFWVCGLWFVVCGLSFVVCGLRFLFFVFCFLGFWFWFCWFLLVGRSVGRLVGWLVDWLLGCLVEWLDCSSFTGYELNSSVEISSTEVSPVNLASRRTFFCSANNSGEKVTTVPVSSEVDDGRCIGQLASPLHVQKRERAKQVRSLQEFITLKEKILRVTLTTPKHWETSSVTLTQTEAEHTRVLLEEHRDQSLSEAKFEILLHEGRAETA